MLATELISSADGALSLWGLPSAVKFADIAGLQGVEELSNGSPPSPRAPAAGSPSPASPSPLLATATATPTAAAAVGTAAFAFFRCTASKYAVRCIRSVTIIVFDIAVVLFL